MATTPNIDWGASTTVTPSSLQPAGWGTRAVPSNSTCGTLPNDSISPEYSDDSAKLILVTVSSKRRSSTGPIRVGFRTHKEHLASASVNFSDMLSTCESSTQKKDEIFLEESSETIGYLLPFMEKEPQKFPDLLALTSNALLLLYRAARKYQMWSAHPIFEALPRYAHPDARVLYSVARL